MDELQEVSQVEALLERIAVSMERNEVLLTNVQTLTSDMFNLHSFTFPLLLGVCIGAVAMKVFWEGVSRW